MELKEEKWIAPAPRGGWRTVLHPEAHRARVATDVPSITARVIPSSFRGAVVACAAPSALPLSRHAT